MTPATRTQYRAAVAQVAATAHAKLPECTGRIDSAVKLVLLGEVTLLPDGTATVGSCSDPARTYTVNGRCDCQDFARAPGQLCKHRLAYGIARRAAELTPPSQAEPPVSPPAPAPLPEAAVSVNCHLTIAGRQVQVTLRGTDEAEVLTRLEAVLARYPSPQAVVPQGQEPREGWCAIHNVSMKRNEKNGRTWYSHPDPEGEGWCKGRRSR